MADSFICGTCGSTFFDLNDFSYHKEFLCKSVSSPPTVQNADLCTQQGERLVSVAQTSYPANSSLSNDSCDSLQAILQGYVEVDSSGRADRPEHHIAPVSIQIVTMETDGEQVPLQVVVSGANTEVVMDQTLQDDQDPGLQEFKPEIKKRGRPLGSKKQKFVPRTEAEKPNPPKRGSDGKYQCTRCHKHFTRERQIVSHICFKKEESFQMANDNDTEPILAHLESIECSKEPAKENGSEVECVDRSAEFVPRQNKDGNLRVCEEPDTQTREGTLDGLAVGGWQPGVVDELPPVFTDDKDKSEFMSVNFSIDLAVVDYLISPCLVQPNDSEQQLGMYTCRKCLKVMKNLSQSRLHCLIHTDLKPFCCTKCSYTTNSRGSLLTHMRQHTGQQYQCPECHRRFNSRSHMLDHQATHQVAPQHCRLCTKNKSYNTVKSLSNHVRRYHHTSVEGKQYLQELLAALRRRDYAAPETPTSCSCEFCQSKFPNKHKLADHMKECHVTNDPTAVHTKTVDQVDENGKPNGILHRCTVCCKYFKTRRHLCNHTLTHTRGMVIQQAGHACSVCQYKSMWPDVLAKHLVTKHKMIYICSTCGKHLPSFIRLEEHLRDHCCGPQVENIPSMNSTQQSSSVSKANAAENIEQTCERLGCGFVNSIVNEEMVSSKEIIKEASGSAEAGELTVDHSYSILTPGHQDPADLQHIMNTPEFSQGQTIISSNFSRTPAGDTTSTADSQLVYEPTGCSDSLENPEAGYFLETSTSVFYDEVNIPVFDEQLVQSSEKSNVRELLKKSVACSWFMPLRETEPEHTEVDLGRTPAEDASATDSYAMDQSELDMFTSANDSDELLDELTNPSPSTAGEQRQQNSTAVYLAELGYERLTVSKLQQLRSVYGCLECAGCGKFFHMRHEYQAHLDMHLLDKQLHCSQCQFSADTEDSLKKHLQKKHSQLMWKCVSCDYQTRSKSQLSEHQKLCRILTLNCPHCTKTFSSEEEHQLHLQVAHSGELVTSADSTGKPRRTFSCPWCPGTVFVTMSQYQHHKSRHIKFKRYKCSHCSKVCQQPSQLREHVKLHAREQVYLCCDCGKTYRSRTSLRYHQNSHVPGKAFKCDQCPYKATQRSHLIRHQESHKVTKHLLCSNCAYSCNSMNTLKIHFAHYHKGQVCQAIPSSHHGRTNSVMVGSTSLTVFTCPYCNFLFTNDYDFCRHMCMKHKLNKNEARAMAKKHNIQNQNLQQQSGLTDELSAIHESDRLSSQQQSHDLHFPASANTTSSCSPTQTVSGLQGSTDHEQTPFLLQENEMHEEQEAECEEIQYVLSFDENTATYLERAN